jgi:hypothetical protein
VPTGEDEKQLCVECNPEAFTDDERPKMFLPLCKEHLEKVALITVEQIKAAVEQGQKDYEACLDAGSSFVPPQGFFR